MSSAELAKRMVKVKVFANNILHEISNSIFWEKERKKKKKKKNITDSSSAELAKRMIKVKVFANNIFIYYCIFY